MRTTSEVQFFVDNEKITVVSLIPRFCYLAPTVGNTEACLRLRKMCPLTIFKIRSQRKISVTVLNYRYCHRLYNSIIDQVIVQNVDAHEQKSSRKAECTLYSSPRCYFQGLSRNIMEITRNIIVS